MIARPTCSRRGFTLLEMLSVIGMFSICIAVLTASLGLLMRLREQGDRHDDQLSQLHQTAHQFREDIHEGLGFPESSGDLKVSEKLFLVEFPKDRVVAWKDGETGLARAEFKKGENPKWTLVLENLRKPRGTFTREGELVRLEISDQHRKTAPQSLRLVVEAAVPVKSEATK